MLHYYAKSKVPELRASPIFQQDGAPPQWSVSVQSHLDTKLLQHSVLEELQ